MDHNIAMIFAQIEYIAYETDTEKLVKIQEQLEQGYQGAMELTNYDLALHLAQAIEEVVMSQTNITPLDLQRCQNRIIDAIMAKHCGGCDPSDSYTVATIMFGGIVTDS